MIYIANVTFSQWGKDKTPNAQGGFDPVQSYSPQNAQTPAFPGTPTYYPQYGGKSTCDSWPSVSRLTMTMKQLSMAGSPVTTQALRLGHQQATAAPQWVTPALRVLEVMDVASSSPRMPSGHSLAQDRTTTTVSAVTSHRRAVSPSETRRPRLDEDDDRRRGASACLCFLPFIFPRHLHAFAFLFLPFSCFHQR